MQTSGHCSFGTAEDGDSGAGGGGGPFRFSNEESSEVVVRRCGSHVQGPVASEPVRFIVYKSINAYQ